VSSNGTFAIAKPHVVADEVDGEVIAIHLGNGAYFSFRGSASTIWQLLLAGDVSADELVERLRASYAGERSEIADAVVQFLARLAAEGLIVSAEPAITAGLAAVDAPARSRPAADRAGDDRASARAPFVVPTLEKFTDMEQFLLVDPIHEVEIDRWPKVDKRD
jgi:hypothetical protein